MQHENAADRPDRGRTAESGFVPADTLFVRLRHQTALLAAADALRTPSAAHPRWGALLHDYALASDRVVSVHGDADAATLGWLKPRGVVALLVTEDCSDDHAVEHLAAALSAMNAVTLTIDDERAWRLRPLLGALTRLLPDAFAELPVRPHVHYPTGATAAVLTPHTLYCSWAPPEPLAGAARDDDERLALLTLYGRVRQLEVRPT